jgi:uncharacterized membrane protein
MSTSRGVLAVFGAVVLTTACSAANESLSQRACPAGGTPLTYENFGAEFFAQWCESCHAASSTNRNGAPPNVTFDTQAEVIQWKDRIYARAADDNTSMPLGPNGPDTTTRFQLGDWLACGAP